MSSANPADHNGTTPLLQTVTGSIRDTTLPSSTAASLLDTWLQWLMMEYWRMLLVVGLPLAAVVLLILMAVVCCVRGRRSRRKMYSVPGLESDADPVKGSQNTAEDVEAAAPPVAETPRYDSSPDPDSGQPKIKTYKPLPVTPTTAGCATDRQDSPVSNDASGFSTAGAEGREALKPGVGEGNTSASPPKTPPQGHRERSKATPRPMRPLTKSRRHKKSDSIKQSRRNRDISYTQVELRPSINKGSKEVIIATEEPTQYAKIAGSFHFFKE